MIDALASLTAWIIVGSLALLLVGWLLSPAILGGARFLGWLIDWLETRRG